MPLPRPIARLNRRFTNRLMMPLAKRVPGFAIVHHTGRRSGNRYQAPVNYFPVNGDVIIALTYGPDPDWLANIEAKPASLEIQGSAHAISGSEMVGRTVAWPHLPGFVRLLLRLIRVEDFVRLSLVDTDYEE